MRGSVLDNGGEALPQASVRLLAARDSSLVKAVVTADNGRFRLDGVGQGSYIVEASYVGFNTDTRNINVGSTDVRLKPFRLSESSIALGEAVVVGQRTPIKVAQDTVEFDAQAYHTQPTAVVEDLLKRLPGVEVSNDGKITANGKDVTKILVDGKEFFSDDPTVASRNLPVDMVDKLQVVDRKSDLARMTGVDDGEEETVINLTVKKDRKNGWFGNAEVGYGTDNRYKATANVNRFWNGNQITFLAGANNVNDPGFADGASGRFRRFGGVDGIKTSQAAGINFNVGNEEIFRIGGNVMYSHNDQHTITGSDRTYLFADSTSTVRGLRDARDKSHNFRVDLRMEWKPDSFNTLEFRPNISLNWSDSRSVDSTRTYAGDISNILVNRSINNSYDHGHSFEFSGRLIYNLNSRRRRGRSFSTFVNYRFSNLREYSDTWSRNYFYLADSADVYRQDAENHTWSNNIMARVTWTEPLGDVANGHFIQLAYRFNYRWNNADKMVYDYPVEYPDGFLGDPVFGPEGIFSSELSNSFRNNFMSQDIRLGYRRVTRKANFNIGISLVPSMSKSLNLINSDKTIPLRRVLNVAPFLRYRYRFSKTRNLSADYRGRSSQPTMTQLQPVADVSDPLRVVVGNPALKPSFTHHASIRYHDFNGNAARSMMLMLDAQYTQNSIISRTDFDRETGGQVTTYENVNGIWNARLMNMLSFPLRNRTFSITNHIFANYSSTVGYNNGMHNRSGSFRISESFGIAWRPKELEIELRPRYSFQNVHNTIQKSANRNVHTYGGSFYVNYSLSFGLGISSDLNYSATSGYSDGYDTKVWKWDATLSYDFLRDRQATVSLKAYDILGQQSNVRRSVTANYINDERFNSLGRYVMLTLAYRFNTFGKGNEPQLRSEGRWGRRGPMGPPPGAPRHR